MIEISQNVTEFELENLSTPQLRNLSVALDKECLKRVKTQKIEVLDLPDVNFTSITAYPAAITSWLTERKPNIKKITNIAFIKPFSGLSGASLPTPPGEYNTVIIDKCANCFCAQIDYYPDDVIAAKKRLKQLEQEITQLKTEYSL